MNTAFQHQINIEAVYEQRIMRGRSVVVWIVTVS